MKKKIIAIILFIVLYIVVFDFFVKGSVGLSQKTYACLGMELAPDHALIQKSPKAKFSFRYPFDFRYEVSSEGPEDSSYCLGKSVLNGR